MKQKIKNIIQNKKNLAENEVKDLLKEYGIQTTKYQLIQNADDIENLKLDFPVALKVCSREILHKTDVGGVQLNISSKDELKKHVEKFQEKFSDENLLVEEMVESGVEVIIGLTRDSTFGLSLMVGVGGIYTELYEDVSFRVVPIEKHSAYEMIEEIKGKKLLEGFRGIKADKEQVINLLMKVSHLGNDLIDYVDQMDLNPIFVYKDDYCVVDAKMVLKN